MNLNAEPEFGRLFRHVAGIVVDEADLPRFQAFVIRKLAAILQAAQQAAASNQRGFIENWDLPLTNSLRGRMREFEEMDEGEVLRRWFMQLSPPPELERELSPEVEDRLGVIAGGLGVALVRGLALLRPEGGSVSNDQWQQATELFDLVV
jgi:hypothetical protein